MATKVASLPKGTTGKKKRLYFVKGDAVYMADLPGKKKSGKSTAKKTTAKKKRAVIRIVKGDAPNRYHVKSGKRICCHNLTKKQAEARRDKLKAARK